MFISVVVVIVFVCCCVTSHMLLCCFVTRSCCAVCCNSLHCVELSLCVVMLFVNLYVFFLYCLLLWTLKLSCKYVAALMLPRQITLIYSILERFWLCSSHWLCFSHLRILCRMVCMFLQAVVVSARWCTDYVLSDNKELLPSYQSVSSSSLRLAASPDRLLYKTTSQMEWIKSKP